MTRVTSCSMGATSISSVVAVGILSLQRTLSRCDSCSGSVTIHHNAQVFREKNLKTSCKPQTSKRSKHPRCWTASCNCHQPQHLSLHPQKLRLRPPTPLVRGWGAAPWMSWRQCLHLPAAGLLIWLTFVALGGWPLKEVLSSRQLTDLRRSTLRDMLAVADETKCVGRLVDNPNYFHVQAHLCNDMQRDCIPYLKLDGCEWTFVMSWCCNWNG